MEKKFNIIQVGFGPMGQLVTKLLLKRKNINLKGVVDIEPNFTGKSVGELLEIDQEKSLIVSKDLDSLLNGTIDVVIIATSSFLETITPMIHQIVEKKINVISLCEQLSYPWDLREELSKEIDEVAKEHGVTVVGSGINPGYLMDLLPIVLTAP
nr:hypothetical protein [Asgard group archaeon]